MQEPAEQHGAFFSLEQPLEAIPNEDQIRSASLAALPRLAREYGIDPQPLFAKHHLDIKALDDPETLISCSDFTALLEDFSLTVNDPLFGVKLAQQHEPDIYGCVVALCRAAANVRQGINSFIKYIRVTHSQTGVQELAVDGDTAEYRWYVRSDLNRNQQANFHAALLFTKLLRQIAGQDFKPIYVKLRIDTRDVDIAELERQFGCRFYSTTASNCIGFPSDCLERPLPGASKLLYTLLSGYLDRARGLSEVSLPQKVENYIRNSLSSGHCSIEHCAQDLGMAVRTLQTKLGETGQEFSTILEQQRHSLAEVYLKHEPFTLDDVAAHLGYAEQSSFGRAFKRWTGISPKQYRQELKQT